MTTRRRQVALRHVHESMVDLVAVINSVITDTGQAIECVALIMAAFLIVNLTISSLMNVLNARGKIAQR